MNLIILGKGNVKHTVRYNTAVTKLWTVGTSDYERADLYFELHGLEVKHPEEKVIREVPDYLKDSDLPLNNSICIMLTLACLHCNFDEIRIVGCPMLAETYIEEGYSLAYLVGLFKGMGHNVIWDDLPENTHYGLRGGQAL